MCTLCDSCVSWTSQLQYIVALFTSESDYIVSSKAIKEILWFRGLLNELGVLNDNMIAYSDN